MIDIRHTHKAAPKSTRTARKAVGSKFNKPSTRKYFFEYGK